MLMQTNSYVVPKDRRVEHARLVQRFRQTMLRLGCEHFEVYEQVGPNWAGEGGGRFVQLMRFRDRRHQQQVQQAEKTDTLAQDVIREFCELINLPYQQQQGLFAMGFYSSVVIQDQARHAPAQPGPNRPGGRAAAAAAVHDLGHPEPVNPPADDQPRDLAPAGFTNHHPATNGHATPPAPQPVEGELQPPPTATTDESELIAEVVPPSPRVKS